MGPTGAGKTAAVLSLDPERYEIIGCDSRQIYREMIIGTAAPTPEEMSHIPHHCVECISPDGETTAAAYVDLADRAILDVRSRGKIPVVVGGTGFYFRALVTGLFSVEVPERIRKEVRSLTMEEKWRIMYQRDPDALQKEEGLFENGKIHPNDDYRLGRALEILLATNKPWSVHWKEARERPARYRVGGIKILPPPGDYRERIRKRAEQMIRAGFVEEAKRIREQYGPDCPGLRSLGYREALQVADGELKGDEFLELLVRLHFRYGKKQISWFRSETGLETISFPDGTVSETFSRLSGG